MKLRKDNKSRFLGVSWSTASKKWLAQITADGVTRNLGSYADPKEAAKAFDKAARKFRGPDARVNFK